MATKVQDYFDMDISPYLTPADYQAGDVICEEGVELNRLIFIEEGTAKCTQTQANGVVSLLVYLTGPSFIGDLELVGARKYTSGITAISNCHCTVVDLRYCREQVLSDVRFLRYLCYNFAGKTERNGRNLTMGNSYPLKNRLATFILETQNGGRYTIPHTEASSYLGVTYRHFLYVLAQFVQEGWLAKTKAGYAITDEAALKSLEIHSDLSD